MDEQAAAVREIVDANGGRWTGRFYELLDTLGCDAITLEAGAEIKTRLNAANLSIKPDIALPGLLKASWVSVTADAETPP